MSFNLLDIGTVVYVAYAVWRGRRRGLAFELPRVLKVFVLAFTGAGLWHWTGAALDQFSKLTRQHVGTIGGAGLMVAAYFLVQHFKAQIRAWAEKKFPDGTLQRRGGAVLGGLHALVLSSFLIVFIGLFPGNPLKGPFAQGSFIGRNLIHYIVPVYENVSGQSHK